MSECHFLHRDFLVQLSFPFWLLCILHQPAVKLLATQGIELAAACSLCLATRAGAPGGWQGLGASCRCPPAPLQTLQMLCPQDRLETIHQQGCDKQHAPLSLSPKSKKPERPQPKGIAQNTPWHSSHCQAHPQQGSLSRDPSQEKPRETMGRKGTGPQGASTWAHRHSLSC